METPKTTFRIELEVLRLADRLLEDPPSVVIDADLGKPRNRTELVNNLIRFAGRVAEQEKAIRPKK